MPNINETLTKPTAPYIEISESNSSVFLLQENIDNQGVYESVFNTFAEDRSVELPISGVSYYKHYNYFKVLFRCNYDNIEIKEIVDGVVSDLNYSLETKNIGLKDGYDCIVKPYLGKMAVLFETGNQYDYDTETAIGTHTFNGFLPEFCKEGNYVSIGSLGNFEIESIAMMDGSDVAVIDHNIPTESNEICYSIYNRSLYNIYSFIVHFNEKTNSIIGLKTTDDRSSFDDVVYVSEKMIVDDLDESLELVWWNDTNTSDLDYVDDFFGIQHVSLDTIERIEDNDNSTNKTDNSIIPVGSLNYQGYKIVFRDLTEMMARKICAIFASEVLYINRLRHSVLDSVKTERVGLTNSYTAEVEVFESDRYNPNKVNGYVADRNLTYEPIVNQGIGSMVIGSTFIIG